MKQYGMLCIAVLLFLFFTAAVPGQAQNIIYPADANIIDITKPPYNADKTGVLDATNQIQQACDDYATENYRDGTRRGTIIYFPDGIYKVSGNITLIKTGVNDTKDRSDLTLQGQSRQGTVIKLAAGATGFGDQSNPKSVITTIPDIGPSGTNRAFRNNIKDLTVDVGDHRGAIGIIYVANNQGTVDNVRIKSSSVGGWSGLDMRRRGLPGPAFIKNVEIEGFEYGIDVFTRGGGYSMVLEYITLSNQRRAGLRNERLPLSIRKLNSTNTVPAILNTNADGQISLVDSELDGGNSSNAAIVNDGHIFVRNVNYTGYAGLIKNKDTLVNEPLPNNEYVSNGDKYSLNAGNPSALKSMNLPIKDMPQVPWDSPDRWVNVADFGANGQDTLDDTPAILAAIASMNGGANNGKTTLYFPHPAPGLDKINNYYISSTITVSGNVRRIIGLKANIFAKGSFRTQEEAIFKFTGNVHNVLVIEDFAVPFDQTTAEGSGSKCHFVEQASSDVLVLKNCLIFAGAAYRNTKFGDVFIEDVCAGGTGAHMQSPVFKFHNQNAWVRQINPEESSPGIVNDGATLWILGLKSEFQPPILLTENGGKTEVLGGFVWPGSIGTTTAAFSNDNSSLSITGFSENFNQSSTYKNVVQERINGSEWKYLPADSVPKRVSSSGFGFLLPFYASYRSPSLHLNTQGSVLDFSVCDTIQMTAQPSDFQDEMSEVSFYYGNDQLIGKDTDGNDGWQFNLTVMEPGYYNIYAIATDSADNTATSDTLAITVTPDTTAPVIAVKNLPAVLWPPNHKYHSFKISDFVLSVTDSCAGILPLSGLRITEVTSDEAELAPGSGHTVNDVLIAADCQSVQLRAERQGNGNGRVYTIEVAITDPVGNEGSASYQVQVPHHPGAVAQKDAASYSVACGESPATSILEWLTKKLANLLSCYPNPFSEKTTIRYYLTTPALVRLDVYNVLGIKVATLVQKQQEAGAYQVILDGTNLQNGLYVGRLQIGSEVQTVKMLLKKERS